MGIFSIRNTLSPVSTSSTRGSHDLTTNVPLNPLLQLWVGNICRHIDYSKQASLPVKLTGSFQHFELLMGFIPKG